MYSNSFGARGAGKISKALSKSNSLRTLNVNFNGNQIALEGAKDVILALRNLKELDNLEINLRNIGLGKDEGKSFKSDLADNR